jgi:hypothetical protein
VYVLEACHNAGESSISIWELGAERFGGGDAWLRSIQEMLSPRVAARIPSPATLYILVSWRRYFCEGAGKPEYLAEYLGV